MHPIRILTTLALALAGGISSSLAGAPPPPGKNAVPIFDGKSLTGWEGNAKLWKVQDGAIAGGSLTETVARNEFLATEKSYADFELRAKIKITGAGGFINSGIQIRSQRVPNDSEMAGYQCDAGDGWWGKIYDEHGNDVGLFPVPTNGIFELKVQDGTIEVMSEIGKGVKVPAKHKAKNVGKEDYREILVEWK